MNKYLIYSWDISKNDLIKNQKVDIEYTPCGMNVIMKQNMCTPGVVINKYFCIEKNKKYIINVFGCIHNSKAFIWAEDINKTRLTENYIYLNSELSCKSAIFSSEIDTKIHIGVLVTCPIIDDTFYIESISLFESITNDIDNDFECNLNQINCYTHNNCNSIVSEDNYQHNLINSYQPIKNVDNYYHVLNSSYKYLYNINNVSYLNINNYVYSYHKVGNILHNIEESTFNTDNLIQYIKCSTNNIYKKNTLSVGYLFFSQLLTNDITHVSVSSLIPTFNLSSIYEDKLDNSIFNTQRLFITKNNIDIYRDHLNNPFIPDIRNDFNIILSQTHLIFQLLHNKLMKNSIDKNIINKFNKVKKEVIYTYQWIIVYDFLYKLVDNSILDSIFENKSKYYHSEDMEECIPLEFIMLLKSLNNMLLPNVIKLNETSILNESDLYSYKYNYCIDDPINWSCLFEVDELNPPYYSKKINTNIIEDLNYTYNIYDDSIDKTSYNSVLLNDILFSQYNELPCGQHIAHMFNIPPIDKSIFNDNVLEDLGMVEKTPFLIYVLKEADIFKRGKQLTGIGGIIIAEVILSILFDDKNSFFNEPNGWKPSIPSKVEGYPTLVDIVNYIKH